MAHPDLDALLNAVLPFAQQMLGRHGEFHPIGASMARDGQVALAAGMPESERSLAQDVIEVIIAGLRERASTHEIRASIVCYDGRVIPPGSAAKTDAICAQLEHESGECAALFLPYRKVLFGRLKYGEFFASRAEPRVFTGAAG